MSDMRPYSVMAQMISQCEQALEREDWSELGQTKTIDDYNSVALCNSLGFLFEHDYQVIKRRQSLRALEMPIFLSPIRLCSPDLRLNFSDEEDNQFNLMPVGDVPVSYIDIILDTTFGNDYQPYQGPHLVGIVDTEMFDTQCIQEGMYCFMTPLKLVEVSQLHIPKEFN